MHRRALLLSAAAATLPLPRASRAQELSDCGTRREDGDWTFRASLTGDARDTPQNFTDHQLMQSSRLVAELDRSAAIPGRFVFRDVTSFDGNFRLQFHYPPNKNIPEVIIAIPYATLDDGSSRTRGEILSTSPTVRIHVDGRDMGSASVTNQMGLSLDAISDPVYRALLDGSEMKAEISISDTTFATVYFDVTGTRDAVATGFVPGLNEMVADIRASAGCMPHAVSPCVMTTAAVGLMGRADDCFELTQMRRLRARFGAAEPRVLDHYVRTSHRILSRPMTRGRRAAILAFWALAVLPTATLARLGAMRAARRTYLAGFAVLDRLLA
ncbi:hypothetical protein K1T73_08480 [Roseovarius sp. SCSIO 43702]|uniref:hypothetical protein n=1 Tax=Roseovarius sp. SCSIO 43702 TaxID=2823043 RepID=UPI001C738312|nr:hypothetical protein [Roseovarius sp. SCSIO 43702]QYX58374.1 hypothetical protein K1T73_08480 [Roseovarius sp. SCSIO 43702]